MGTNKAEGKRSLKEMEDEEDQEEDDNNESCEDNNGGNEDDKKKKGKMGSSGSMAVVFCQAENCGADMNEAKKYHRRHKVCEFHAKASYAFVNGTQQRFCQQCSRFHELSEFDENKRSCRSRLAGHNERRRKNTHDYHGEASN